MAACEGYIEIVQLLLDQGADIAAVDGDGSTAPHSASRKGHTEVVRPHLGHGANVGLADKRTTSNQYILPLTGASSMWSNCCDKGAVITAVAYEGSTPLHYAAFNGQVETVKLLLDISSDRLDTGNLYARTPLS